MEGSKSPYVQNQLFLQENFNFSDKETTNLARIETLVLAM